MTRKTIKQQILEAGYHPTPELVAAIETAIESLVTPALIEREFRKLAKLRKSKVLASPEKAAEPAAEPPATARKK
jgi:hypothetical protein